MLYNYVHCVYARYFSIVFVLYSRVKRRDCITEYIEWSLISALKQNVGIGFMYGTRCSSWRLLMPLASRHVLLRSKVLEEVVCFYNVMLRMSISLLNILHFLSMNNAMGKLQGRGLLIN